VKAAARLSDVAEKYVKVRRAGQSVTACCPFHDDASPSLGINDEKGLYHCFGCGAGGNLFTFVREVEGVGFAKAVELLAEQVGIELERDGSGSGGGYVGRARVAAAQDALAAAAQWCVNCPRASFFRCCYRGGWCL